jgi:hypothetical protein
MGCPAWHGIAWLGTIRHDPAWLGTAWRSAAWHGTAQHGMAQRSVAWPLPLQLILLNGAAVFAPCHEYDIERNESERAAKIFARAWPFGLTGCAAGSILSCVLNKH